MKLKLFITFILLISKMAFCQVYDELNMFKSDDINLLSNRINYLERNSNINFMIFIVNDEKKGQNNLKNLKKSVIIYLVRESSDKLKIKLSFTEDLDIMGYEDEINNLLDRLEIIINNGDYLDILYELTGDIVDIVLSIENERKQIKNEEAIKNLRVIVFVISMIITLFLALILYFRILKYRRKFCSHCSIEMALCNEYEEGSKKIKIYECKVCGYSKKIISFRH